MFEFSAPYNQASFHSSSFLELLNQLLKTTSELENGRSWPGHEFDQLADADVLRWVIPAEWDGTQISAEELVLGYEMLAQACLVTTFVLTQRNGACQRIVACDNESLKAELLPGLARGDIFATVGISHLTTSRQHLQTPAVRVEQTSDRFIMSGSVPWVTGANHTDYVVTGGTCDDGRQVLIAVPTSLAGVTVGEPVRLMALNASQTGPVVLDKVEVDKRFLLAGPAEQVMKLGTGGGTGSLATSALAVGTAAASLARLKAEAVQRPDLNEAYKPLLAEHDAIANDMRAAARGDADTENPCLSAESIRQRANSLVLRSAQAYLAAAKGAGFAAGHPASRAVREAMFFLVWSCPQPVLSAALREFACSVSH